MRIRKRLFELSVLCLASVTTSAQTIERISVGLGGANANGASNGGMLSGDGRYVLFTSSASNLVASDSNGSGTDLFVRDRVAQTTQIASLGPSGNQVPAYGAVISDNGRYVAFTSGDLVPQDMDGIGDVYVRDLVAGTTTWVSPWNDPSSYGVNDISADGHVVCSSGSWMEGFSYSHTTIGALDFVGGASIHYTGSVDQVYYSGSVFGPLCVSGDGRFVDYRVQLYYPDTGSVVRVELATGSTQGFLGDFYAPTPIASSFDGRYVLLGGGARYDTLTAESRQGFLPYDGSPLYGATGLSLSDDGRYASGTSDSTHLVPGDTNGHDDAFLWDFLGQTGVRVSLGSTGQQLNADALSIHLAAGAAAVAFSTAATNVVPGDTNGVSDVFVRSNCFTTYVDLDGDGYGLAGTAQLACLPAPGRSLNDLDCNDADASRHPNAIEVCNGIDDDCDGTADDGLTATYYFDGDGDGYGDPSTALVTCSPGGGYILVAQDCNDANASVHPGASESANGVDDDCDGTIDEGFEGSGYCTAGTTTHGCVPQISAAGSLRASASSGYVLSVAQVEGQKNGLLFYGFGSISAQWAPFSSSLLCVAAPRQRTSASNSGGTVNDCNGQLSIDARAWMAANPGALGQPISAGQSYYFQGWFRDPSAPKGTNLSAGWNVTAFP